MSPHNLMSSKLDQGKQSLRANQQDQFKTTAICHHENSFQRLKLSSYQHGQRSFWAETADKNKSDTNEIWMRGNYDRGWVGFMPGPHRQKALQFKQFHLGCVGLRVDI